MNAFKKPKIVTRKEWGAMEPTTRIPGLGKPSRIVVHHSWKPTSAQYIGAKTIRGIQKYHIEDRRWSDIGYHFLIGPDGLIYEGRPVDRLGAHCGGSGPTIARRNFGNAGSIGICLIGDFDTEEPTQEAVNAFVSLVVWLQDELSIPNDAIFGHCEAMTPRPKSCPGKHIMATLVLPRRCPA